MAIIREENFTKVISKAIKKQYKGIKNIIKDTYTTIKDFASQIKLLIE